MLLLLAVPLAAVAQMQSPRMQRFLASDGLPSRQVLQLAKDSKGNIWAATADGLARMDGTEIRVWQHQPGQRDSLPLNYIESLAIDDEDRVWVGSNGMGLLRLRADGSGFDVFPEITLRCGRQVWSLAWMDGVLWVGGNGEGLCLVDKQGRIRQIGVGGQPDQLPDGQIYVLRPDQRGRMWIGTGAGLVRWENDQLHRVAQAQLGNSVITRISVDSDGRVWVGSHGQLWQLRVADEALTAVNGPQGEPLRSAAVLQDNDGTHWLGTAAGLYLQRDGRMQQLQGGALSGLWMPNSTVVDMLQDHEGGLWFATYSQGLAYLPPDWRRFGNVHQFQGELLESIGLTRSTPDGDGFLISSDAGLFRLDGQGQLSRLLSRKQVDDKALWSVLVLPDGRILLGGRGQLFWYERHSGRLSSKRILAGDDPFQRVDLMTLMPDGSIWMQVFGVGLQQRSADGRLLRQLKPGGPEGLLDELIHQLRPGPDGSLWITSEGGVQRWQGNRLVTVSGLPADLPVYDIVFAYPDLVWLAGEGMIGRYRWTDNRLQLQEHAGPAEGVPSVSLGGLLLADSGQVWATSSRGLVRWAGKGQVQVFGISDGLAETEFLDHPPSRNARRGLALNSGGLVHFDLDQPPQPLPPSQLQISALEVRVADSAQLQPRPLLGGLVTLQPDDRELLITARLLTHVGRNSQRYRFRLRDHEQDWFEVGVDGQRSLAGLPAGHYVMEVQARSGQSGWSESTTFGIQVLPHWWASAPARVVWVLCGFLLLGLAWLVFQRRRQQHRRWQALRQRQQLAEQSSQFKTHFLSALGHEVRTPLTGVIGMSELLMETPLDQRQRNWVSGIQNAGGQLLNLLDDALDMAGIEAGRLQLQCQPFSLQSLLAEVARPLQQKVQAKGLTLVMPGDLPGPVCVHGDMVRLRQVLNNLLANAIRHTHSGTVALQVKLDSLGRGLCLEVHDSGEALSADNQRHLFDRFQGRDNAQLRVAGGGVGLAISRELVHAMGGSVQVHSDRGGGNCISVQLPLRWELERAEQPLPSVALPATAPVALKILLVEDDRTVAEVICALLQARGHQVSHVVNGLQALSLIATEEFDAGLLDLDLPGIDGLSLARQIRAMGKRLPLLAVTARSDAQAEGEVCQAGFDAYVRKPVTGVLLAEALVGMLREQDPATAKELA